MKNRILVFWEFSFLRNKTEGVLAKFSSSLFWKKRPKISLNKEILFIGAISCFSDVIKNEQKEDQVSAADVALLGNDSVHNDSSSDGAFSFSLVFGPFDDLRSYLDH